ncbi:MAG: hypothetical protein P1U36_00730, partial [Legionellaceae bacterium]|nr:hypothetical protein [Legionellaceae bacterium]
MPISNEILERLQTNDPLLTSLELWDKQIDDIDAAHLAAALKQNTTLTRLNLGHNHIGDAGTAHLAAALKENTALTEFHLLGNQIHAVGAAHLAAALKENTTLTELNLGHNYIGNTGVKHLAAALKQNTTLTKLYLTKNQIDADGAAHLAALLEENATLTILDLMSNQISVAGARSLADALKQNNTLTELNLWGTQIGSTGAKHLATALIENTTLTNLGLESNQIRAVGAKYLAAALKQNNTLTELNLDFNEIGNAGAEHLADALKEDSVLTSLDLRYNQVDFEGAEFLAEALKENTALTKLNLANNQISISGARYLADALKQNTALTKLNLADNHIGDLGAAHLAAALKENDTLLKLEGVSSPEIDALLSKESRIANCLRLLKDFTTPGALDLKLINKAIETLVALAPELHDENNPAPEDSEVSEGYRLLCALSHLNGSHALGALELLKLPMRHPQFAIIADKVYAEALMVSETPGDQATQVARYKLLAYCGRHNIHSSEFATGLAGIAVPQSGHPNFGRVDAISSNPRKLPNDAYWLSYDELQGLAQSALEQTEEASDEHRLLEAVITQKDYDPETVHMLFKSPLFIHALKTTYPHQNTFECLEGYLDLQHVEGLGGKYMLTTVISDLEYPPRPYGCIQDEVTNLKQLITSSLKLTNPDEDEPESKEDINQAIEGRQRLSLFEK